MFSLKSYWLKLRLFFPLRSWITVSYRVAQLHQLVRILRGPQGCPWDRKQTLNTMLPYVEEEVRELLHAFVHQDNEEVRDEFGDLLFVLFFLEHLFAQNQHFDLNQSIGSTLQKMVRRHPHVFRMQHTKDKEDIEEVWQKTKQQEREEKAKTKTETPEESKKTPQERALQEMRDIPPKCSALHQALHIGYATKKADFDWSNPQQVWNKVLEELDELKYAINHQTSKHQNAELGDLLFSIAQLARHLNINPEQALLQTCQRFIKRFKHLNHQIKILNSKNKMEFPPASSDLEQLWINAKESLKNKELD